MSQRTSEAVATVLTTVGVVAALAWPFFHESNTVSDKIPAGAQVIELTGVATTGTWTEEAVHGGNYWRQDFRSARPVLRAGRPTLLRLKSADVMHSFYAPGLGIESVDVLPGHVVEILVTPEKEGVFGYYCPTMCGDPHFGMRGVIIVQEENGDLPEAQRDEFGRFWLEPRPPAEMGRVALGAWLFRQKGCVTCHGPEGRGGVANWNYVKETVPELNTLAEKMYLFYPEDVAAVLDLLERGVPLESVEDDPPVRRFNVVLAKYDLIRETIRNGAPAGKKDPEGPVPPLEMPAWEHRLSEADIDALISYFLSLDAVGDSG